LEGAAIYEGNLMKKNILTATVFCATLITTPLAHAEDKAAVATAKKETKSQNLSATDIIKDKNFTIDVSVAFVESFSVMGEGEPGINEKQAIESKRNFAAQEIQDESKQFEKAKADYIAKSTTMSDSARDKEEKKLVKMERELKNLVAEKEEELKMDMQIATETLARELETAVAQLAKDENLDVVFDKMTGRAIYVSEKLDYTSKAIEQVNKNYQVKLAQNKQGKTEAPATKLAENKAVSAPKAAKVGA
jgi:Skp family chaperone for outer membrane proteins